MNQPIENSLNQSSTVTVLDPKSGIGITDGTDITFGGFFVRLVAYSFDYFLIVCLLLFIKIPVAFLTMSDSTAVILKNVLFTYNIFDIIYYLLTVFYFILFTYFTQTTPGKYLLKLKVVAADGGKPSFFSILFRETVGRFLSAILCLGYLMIIIDKQKKGFHDYLSDTRVIYSCKIKKVVKAVPVTTAVPYNSKPRYGVNPGQYKTIQNQNYAPQYGTIQNQNHAPQVGTMQNQNHAPQYGTIQNQNHAPQYGTMQNQNHAPQVGTMQNPDEVLKKEDKQLPYGQRLQDASEQYNQNASEQLNQYRQSMDEKQ